jgi:hypothetical protein
MDERYVEVRVRPVVRYIVTRYESGQKPDGASYGGCETIGEFANEGTADTVAMALREIERQGLRNPDPE